MSKNVRSDGVKSLLFIVTVLFIVGGVGGFLGTGGRAFSDPSFLERYTIYMILGAVGLGIFGVLALVNFVNGREVVFVPIHDPEDSLFGDRFLFFRSPVLFALVSILFSLAYAFYFAFVKGTFFSVVPQSVANVSTVWSQAIFPLVENVFFFAILPLILLNIVRKLFFVSNRPVYWGFVLVVIPLLSGFGWSLFHNLVYGAQESAKVSTFVFGVLWVFLTLLFMSQIISLALHFAVNLALALSSSGELASDWTKFFIIVCWVAILLVTVVYARFLSNRRGVYN